MSAPKVKAVGDSKEAAVFRKEASFELLPKNMYFGNMVTNNTTGPTMAANFEFEKKTDISMHKVISDMWNRKK